ncbi:hypothetical protein [Streptomyces wuyuanensis]|uniref:hypothetical protein n=1 Tax=Streptomyces wuyuanensis TaxID=1196353 RepID=UPI00378D2B9C
MTARRVLPEDVPDGTFGGARPRRGEQQRRGPDPEGPRRGARLAAIVAEIDRERGYGVNLRYRTASPAA